MVQQIHSLRARGVMSSHAARAFGEATSAFFKSAGKVCAVPEDSFIYSIVTNPPFLTGVWDDVGTFLDKKVAVESNC